MTDTEVKKLVAMLIAAFPHTKANRYTAVAYEQTLVDLDGAAATQAVHRLMSTRNYMPTIAEVRAAVAEIQHGPVKAGGEAWGDVVRAVGRYGFYRTPGEDFRFSDPVTARCVDALGWRNLCASENSQADRARFIELYDKLAKQHRTEIVIGPQRTDRQLGERSGGTKSVKQILAVVTDEGGDDEAA